MIRSLIGEFGHTVRRGLNHVTSFAIEVRDGTLTSPPECARATVALLCQQFLDLQAQIARLDKMIFAASRQDKRVRLLQTIPGLTRIAITSHRPSKLSFVLDPPLI